MITKEWYYIKNVDDVDSPFLAVFPDRVTANIDALKRIIPDINRLRPDVRAHKCKQAVALMLEYGISKFKCATIAEAEMLALSGATDVLLAYQPVGPKIKRLLALGTSYPATNFACLVDNFETAKEIAKDSSFKNQQVHVWLDLNTGMNRTGTHPDHALALYKSINRMNGITAVGIHGYDGHITASNVDIRNRLCREVFNKVEKLKAEITNAGLPVPKINAGRTATLNFYAGIPEVECSPGTFIYWDQNHQELYPELPFRAAALIIARIISIPNDEVLCLDLGYKALASEGRVDRRICFLNVPDAKITGQSEEHVLLKSRDNHRWRVGDVFYGIPYHIGRTCNLYQMASTVYNHHIQGHWLHFNGRKLSI